MKNKPKAPQVKWTVTMHILQDVEVIAPTREAACEKVDLMYDFSDEVILPTSILDEMTVRPNWS